MDKYEELTEECFAIASKLTLKQYCEALYSCVNSSFGENEDYCEGCPFYNHCIMSFSPDTMIYDVLSGYSRLPDFSSDEKIKLAIEKSLKYDKIVKIVREKSNG